MGKVWTTVVNKTDGEILLQEGNQGVYRAIARLAIDEVKKLRLDPNATYRDYVFVKMPNRAQLETSISSDDFLEYSEIRVLGGGVHPYYLEKIPRKKTPGSRNAATAQGSSASSQGNSASTQGKAAPAPGKSSPKNLFQRIKDKALAFF